MFFRSVPYFAVWATSPRATVSSMTSKRPPRTTLQPSIDLRKQQKGGLMSRIVIVSNRTPSKGPAAGGLAVTLRKVLDEREGFWFGWSGKLSEQPASEARIEDV